MRESINAFFENLKQKKVAVIGLGVSHNDLITMLINKGIKVTLLDKRTKEAIGEKYDELNALGVEFVLGDSYLDELTNFDIVFRAPGVYFLKDEITRARDYGTVITSEMEVFFDLCPCKVIALTGSDGKTTTSTIISEILKESGKTVHLGGNIGRALLPIIEQINEDDICVIELSSFQLISMRKSPDVAVITNIAPNHLDVHKDMAEYVAAKTNIILHQNAFSKTVLNLDNPPCYDLKKYVRGQLLCFSRKALPVTGSFLDEEGNLCTISGEDVHVLFNKDKLKIPGMHNVENFLAAIAAVGDDADEKAIKKVAHSFKGVEHRIEFVCDIDGVSYYNDSIASSPTRTIAGLNAFEQRLIIIAGGYDKMIPYAPLGPAILKSVKLLILLGATAEKIEAAVKACPDFSSSDIKIIHVKTLEEAVAAARQNAVRGDIVSLSPASASFDLYQNFEQRGNHYKSILAEALKNSYTK